MRRVLALLVSVALVVLPRLAAAKGKDAKEDKGLQRLEVPGAPPAYFYRPAVKGTKPVLMYLHGKGGHPAEDCKKWARVGTQFGWVVCPSGPEEAANGGRTWAGGDARRIIDATMLALRAKFQGKVRKRGNILIGFSEGAFVAMQVGLKDQSTWSKWLFLGASDQYWQYDISEALDPQKRKVRRVYLLTGQNDQVAQNTVKVGALLKKSKVRHIVKIVPGLGHEVPSDKMITTYRRPLLWLSADD